MVQGRVSEYVVWVTPGPISYPCHKDPGADNVARVEETPFFFEDKKTVVDIPVVKGSTLRSKWRTHVVKRLMSKLANSGMPSRDVAFLSQHWYVGAGVSKHFKRAFEMEPLADKGEDYELARRLRDVDPVYRYFGYLSGVLPGLRSELSVGWLFHAVRSILRHHLFHPDAFVSTRPVIPDEVVRRRATDIGDRTVFFTEPLESVIVRSRRSYDYELGVFFEAVYKDADKAMEIVQRIRKAAERDKKKDRNNKETRTVEEVETKRGVENLVVEVLYSGLPSFFKVEFFGGDGEDHRALLTMLMDAFQENPTIGGGAVKGHGLCKIEVLDAEANPVPRDDEAVRAFEGKVDPEAVVSTLKKGFKAA